MQSEAAFSGQKIAAGRLAEVMCLTGFFLYILISAPLLEAWGVHYINDDGRFYEKLHPGTVFVLLSFCALLWSGGNPIGKIITLWCGHTIFMAMLTLSSVLLLYMILRSGAGGLGFVIDVQIIAVICAVVLCEAPAALCRVALALFVALAVTNSLVGLAEAVWQVRLIPFDPDWAVANETSFRASALLGHPLNNALFTSVALFVTLAAPYPNGIKLLCMGIYLASLVAFGGRAAMAISLLGLMLLGALKLGTWCLRRQHSVREVLWVVCMLVAVPLLLGAGLYAISHSGVGERLTESFYWDDSAQSRLQAFGIFDYMSGQEILFGMPVERIIDITYRVSQSIPLAAIENPWVLMFMCLGMIAFVLWLAGTLAFAWRLMKGQAVALQFAVLTHFIIASSYNSFGCKSPVYPVMVSAVICAGQARKVS